MSVVFDFGVTKFLSLSYQEQLMVARRGRPTPVLNLETVQNNRGFVYKKQFNPNIYSENRWICGSERKNALFCFPCVLFSNNRDEKIWTETGVNDLDYLSNKMKVHENSRYHLSNELKFVFFGKDDKKRPVDSTDISTVGKYNAKVTENRNFLSKVIDCLKFSAHFDLQSSSNCCVLLELIDFLSRYDESLSDRDVVFDCDLETLQSDVLDCILEVCREEIVREIDDAPFLAEITSQVDDVSRTFRTATICRYVTKNGELVERFWNFLLPNEPDDKTTSELLREDCDSKLIALSYDGPLYGGDGLRSQITQRYDNARFVHCYAHDLRDVLSKTCADSSNARVFFLKLREVSDFFRPPNRVAVLDEIVSRKTGRSLPSDWGIHERTVNVVYGYRDSIIECAEQFAWATSRRVSKQAVNVRRILNDQNFTRWLNFFRYVMVYVYVLRRQLQKKPLVTQIATAAFEENIKDIRDNVDRIVRKSSNLAAAEGDAERKRFKNDELVHRAVCIKVCDALVTDVKDRFVNTSHLVAEALLTADNFVNYHNKFPVRELEIACLSYKMLNKQRLRTELSALYSNVDCREFRGLASIFEFVISNHLEHSLAETKKLLQILLTTPTATVEEQRRFSTLKRIKAFLRDSACHDRSTTALAMLRTEGKFVAGISNFNDKVIDIFARRKCRGVSLALKKIK